MVLVVLVAATAFGLYRALTDGRFRGTHRVRGVSGQPAQADTVPSPAPSAPAPAPAPPAGPVLTPADVGAELGERATLLQFSSAFCAPCRATRHVLADVAQTVPGVRHVEVDAESHLELVRRVSVMRTPTTLVLDADGVEVTRASGALRKPQVLTALGRMLAD